MNPSIHPTSIVHATAVIGAHVALGPGVSVGPFAVIGGRATIGAHVSIGAHAVLGCPPEVRSVAQGQDWIDQPGGPGVTIGDGTVIREGAQIHGGWKTPTSIGADCFIMNQAYIAHDGSIGDLVTLASGVRLAGHVRVGDRANLGMGTTVHQFRAVGALSMVGMSSVVTRDLPAFAKAFGSPARVHGVNAIGAERAGLDSDELAWIHDWYVRGLPDELPPSGALRALVTSSDEPR